MRKASKAVEGVEKKGLTNDVVKFFKCRPSENVVSRFFIKQNESKVVLLSLKNIRV